MFILNNFSVDALFELFKKIYIKFLYIKNKIKYTVGI